MTDKKNYNGLEIAVVGIACHVPGAGNWRDYWRNLIQGVESVDFLTDQELTDLGIDHYPADHANYVNSRTTIKDKNLFDYSFFGYSPAEARLLNPLHRILHQCAWEALEDAGCDPDTHKGLISLYVGSGDDFNWKIYSALKNKKSGDIDDFTLNLINNKDYLASLISYKLNLKGPSLTVNTACSTSLVAINMACKSLLLGESTTALAGGISIATNQQKGYFHQEGMTLSTDGHCRAFDKDADGIVSSEGAGIVVLKRLSSAIKDGDHIYAVIKGSAINNDGNRKVGFTAPSVDGQVECIRKAQIFAQVDPDTINYIEAHGTGTRLGDPIELEALNIAFNRNAEKYCAIGSVKTNIGHLDAAAGVAGLIKTALSLTHR
ncbi:polyketide synthase, partial [Pedobacter sp. UYP1]|uniref:polyketide synthase n=1 Tax=Pedobacter sp. UYP1 TaxID=1756396 RepID=UPI003395AF92